MTQNIRSNTQQLAANNSCDHRKFSDAAGWQHYNILQMATMRGSVTTVMCCIAYTLNYVGVSRYYL